LEYNIAFLVMKHLRQKC